MQNNFCAVSDNGVYLSTDNGNTWEMKPSGLISTSVFAFLNIGSNVLTGTYGAGAFLSADSGKSWQPYPNLNAGGFNAFSESDSALFAATTTDGLLKSTDEGVSWERVLTSVQDPYFRTVGSNGNTVLAASSNEGAYRSSDNGVTWSPIGSGLSDPEIADFSFIESIVYASTTFFGFIFRSTDDGLTWTQSSNGLSPYSSVHKVIKQGHYLFAAAGDGVYRSSDNGNNWSLAIIGMTSTSILTIIAYDSTIIVGTLEGFIYKSTDAGNNWIDISEGLPLIGSSSTNEKIHVVGQNVLCGTYATGVYKSPLSEIVVSVDNPDQLKDPDSFVLGQNYPNPFNPTTTIRFSIQNKSNVKITILNAIGEEVAVVLNEEKEAGFHQVEFNAANLPSGVYFYQLRAGSFVQTKKMILMK